MNDPRAQEGVEHLQQAARELIEAARAFLDVAEGMIDDREFVSDAAGAVAEVLTLAGRRPGQRPSSGSGRDPSPATEEGTGTPEDVESAGGVDGAAASSFDDVGPSNGPGSNRVRPSPLRQSRVRRIEVD